MSLLLASQGVRALAGGSVPRVAADARCHGHQDQPKQRRGMRSSSALHFLFPSVKERALMNLLRAMIAEHWWTEGTAMSIPPERLNLHFFIDRCS
jgi:hypothetical protein